MSAELVTRYQSRVNDALKQRLPAVDRQPQRLHEAMSYSVFNGGKRIRPILVYATGTAVAVVADQLDNAACAVELIHTYSLIHDDLPAMDDDDLRRGLPTCHKAFDEATAILAGDALQSLAFEVLSNDMVDPSTQLQQVAILSQAVGAAGMVGGQVIDWEAVGQQLTLAELENMHDHKTGALIRASVLLGACGQSNLSSTQRQQLDQYARCIGLAFQIQDDILDVTSNTETLGKMTGADQALNKPTYPSLLGLDGARTHLDALCERALAQLTDFDSQADMLRWIARYIVERTH